MINEFYSKEAATPDEARTLANDYLKTVTNEFYKIASAIDEKRREGNNLRGSDSTCLDNMMLARNLISKFNLTNVHIRTRDNGPTYMLHTKRANPICYMYESRKGTTHRKLDYSTFVNYVCAHTYTATCNGTPATMAHITSINTMGEIMRKYFILKPDYLGGQPRMCDTILNTYFLSNPSAPFLVLRGMHESNRFITGDPQFIGDIKEKNPSRYSELPNMTVDTFLTGELYHSTNVVDTTDIGKGVIITGDQSKNIIMWNALRVFGQAYITDEQLLEAKTLGLAALNDAVLTQKFNDVI